MRARFFQRVGALVRCLVDLVDKRATPPVLSLSWDRLDLALFSFVWGTVIVTLVLVAVQ